MRRISSNLTPMHSSQRILQPWLRFTAAATLGVWLAAVAFCTASDTVVAASESHAKPDCSGSASPPDCCHKSSPSSPAKPLCPSNCAPCKVLKTALMGTPDARVIPPTGIALRAVVPFAPAFDVDFHPPTASIFRQARHRDWAFTPEVCLGPAFRSHAPPSLA